MSDQEKQQSVKPANPLASYFRQPKIYIKLPSNGDFYPEGAFDKSVNNEYAVYAMTAKDELMFKTPDALMNGQATVEVIKSCIPAIRDPWKMPSIDLDAALIAIRIATYGEEMDVNARCPQCNTTNEYVLNLLGYLESVNSFEYQSVLQVGPLTIHIRPYNYQEVTKTAIKTLEQQKIFAIVNDDSMPDEEKVNRFGESFVRLTELTVDVVVGCIAAIDTPEGSVNDPKLIAEFIENSPGDVFRTINEHITSMKDRMTLKAHNVRCTECDHEWSVEVTMDQANFFGVGS